MREISLNVLDIAQNSIAAGASLIAVTVEENTGEKTLRVSVKDNGAGMNEEQLSRIGDPFFTTGANRKIGLGVPLFKMAAQMTGGSFDASSAPGEGTEVRASFCTGHIDMKPLGDMGGTLALLITANPQLDFIYTRSVNGKSFALDTRELRGILGECVTFSHPEVFAWIKGFLAERDEALTGSF